MANKNIWHFIKFFEQEQHADQFMAGNLYLNTLAHFKRIESVSDDGRADSTEGVAMWWQPNGLSIKLSIPGIGETEITEKDLAAPVSTSFDHHNYLHIFCLYAVYTTGFNFVGGKVECSPEDAEKLRQQLKIDERCFKFGKFAVVVNAVPFMDQIQEALKLQNHKYSWGMVRYYDEKTFHGAIPRKEIPFTKQKRFSYQQEFRICVHPKLMLDCPITINIGSISRICAKIDSSRLNNHLGIQLEPAA
jgi:hypothetical protein